MTERIFAKSYFDGRSYHNSGPYAISLNDGLIAGIDHNLPSEGIENLHNFVMPGLTEAHCHLFLDGGELDFAKRSAYLKSSKEEKLEVARRNLEKNRDLGITYLCDAGDGYGINVQLQKEQENLIPGIRQAEMGIRKTGRYGGFLARAGSTTGEYDEFIRKVSERGDVLKIVLTGIIDFESGKVKGAPQFSSEELKYIVDKAGEYGLDTMAHCSGEEGLELAISGGVGSIEHGFFMKDHFLSRMRDRQIAWVPTFIPVQFQYDKPEFAGWNEKSISGLKMILDEHRENLLRAEGKGNMILSGSDAGSYGVEHGSSLMEELRIMSETGISLTNLLNWASVAPRRKWGLDDHTIVPGNRADIVALRDDPYEDFTALLDKKTILSA